MLGLLNKYNHGSTTHLQPYDGTSTSTWTLKFRFHPLAKCFVAHVRDVEVQYEMRYKLIGVIAFIRQSLDNTNVCKNGFSVESAHLQEVSQMEDLIFQGASFIDKNSCRRLLQDGIKYYNMFQKTPTRLGGIVQGRAVDVHFSSLSSGLHEFHTIHNRKRMCYRYEETQKALHMQILLKMWPRQWMYIKPEQKVRLVTCTHPFTWMALHVLVRAGYKPVVGQLAVGCLQVRLGTALDGLWYHRSTNSFLVVELKKYETNRYPPSTQQLHLKQLALSTLLFTMTYSKALKRLCSRVKGVILRVHTRGPSIIPLDVTSIQWAINSLHCKCRT